LRPWRDRRNALDRPARIRRCAMIRFLLVLIMLAGTAGAVVAYGDSDQLARASSRVSHIFRTQTASPAPAVQIQRGQGGEFALRAKINGVVAPMVIDTGATSVVLTWETAKAIGLPLEMLEYDVDLETAGGHTKAARLTLERLSVGHLVEKSVPALVVQRGQMKTNLLGMSFLDRLESWGVRADKLMLTGYPELQTGHRRSRLAVD
jgi:clan AA aspartic protease (TIGR02281 family)